jgi:hypothetical protein
MPELSVNRTLVKSPPEVWPEFSEVERLANHLGQFGEISISRLEPEHTVAWEGERASGTVTLEASGEGTKVTLQAEIHETEPERVVQAPTVHQVIPDLEAWDRGAAEIVHHATWQTAAAQRAAQRAAERAEREAKRNARKGLRRHRSEPDPANESAQAAAAARAPVPAAEPRAPVQSADPEHRALAVLETALDNLGEGTRRRFSRS